MGEVVRRILDSTAFLKEFEKIRAIPDEAERNKQEEMLQEIFDKLIDWDNYLHEYEYKQHCQEVLSRGVKATSLDWQTVAAQWDDLFAAKMPQAVRDEIHYEQFKWHIFSYEELHALHREDAQSAFDQQKKDTAYVLFQYENRAYRLENASLLKSEDLEQGYTYTDYYIFDEQRRWTYVHTHELQCGPYFYQAK